MKIGVGCISYARPLHLQHWIKSVSEFSNEEDVIYIADDNKNRKGIAFRTNECLRELLKQGCDYFFILNDDCFPIKKGWEQYFIDASIQSGHHHFQFMKHSADTKILGQAKDLELENGIGVNMFDNTNGCFLFMTRECVELVGGFNPEYFYGFEHANYSDRIHKMGLTKWGKYSCPEKAEKYIYALDLEPESDLHRKLKHKPSMRSIEAVMKVRDAAKIYQNETELKYPL